MHNSCQQHFLMVAHDRLDPAASLQIEQELDHAARVRSAIDDVAKRNPQVVGARVDGGDQRLQRLRTTVDVAKSDDPSGCRLDWTSLIGRVFRRERHAGHFQDSWPSPLISRNSAAAS